MGNRIIEINGKRYDAQSGALLGESSHVALAAKKTALRRHSRVVDGFAPAKKPNTSVNQSNHIQVQKQLAKLQPQKPEKPILRADIQRAKPLPSKAASFHKPEKAKTLMRRSVNKPIAAKKTLKTQGVKEIPAKEIAVATPSIKLAAHHIDKQRLMRARGHRQSSQVQRFTTSQQNHPKQLAAPQTAKAALAAPTAAPLQSISQASAVRSAQRSRATMYQPQRRPAPQAVLAPHHHAAHQTPVPASKSDDIFEAAIANARSHEQPAPKLKRKARNRFVQAGAFLAAFVAIAGFVAYLNMPGIELRIASSKAGFSATLPSYHPTGYAMEGGIQADHGVVRVSFRSGSSSYTLQQQESSWDSQTLLDNVVAIEDASYKVYESQGRTVYVYGDKAAWVNGGVLYSMKINGDISKTDIISIATSV